MKRLKRLRDFLCVHQNYPPPQIRDVMCNKPKILILALLKLSYIFHLSYLRHWTSRYCSRSKRWGSGSRGRRPRRSSTGPRARSRRTEPARTEPPECGPGHHKLHITTARKNNRAWAKRAQNILLVSVPVLIHFMIRWVLLCLFSVYLCESPVTVRLCVNLTIYLLNLSSCHLDDINSAVPFLSLNLTALTLMPSFLYIENNCSAVRLLRAFHLCFVTYYCVCLLFVISIKIHCTRIIPGYTCGWQESLL